MGKNACENGYRIIGQQLLKLVIIIIINVVSTARVDFILTWPRAKFSKNYEFHPPCAFPFDYFTVDHPKKVMLT